METRQIKTPKRRRSLPNLRVGQMVEVRSDAEILATLDENGEFENLPFMPEMLKYCGKRLVVHKVAHKLCDTVSGTGLRWMNDAVHLSGVRCDGLSHGGCETGCSIYWKSAWLKPVAIEEAFSPAPECSNQAAMDQLEAIAKKPAGSDGEERYSCQATEILRAAPERMPFFDLGQYVADLRSGNVGLCAVLRTFFFGLYNVIQSRCRRIFPRWMLINGGRDWGCVKGTVTGKTPTSRLELQPGEVVRIKSQEEISATLNESRLNRGMGFEEEMARHCGRTARVVRRVNRCIDEKTGRMLSMQHPCIVLEGVVCEGVYHGNCPREFLPFWREIWLERVEGQPESAPSVPLQSRCQSRTQPLETAS